MLQTFFNDDFRVSNMPLTSTSAQHTADGAQKIFGSLASTDISLRWSSLFHL